MANPVLIVCNKNVWTKVATAVKTGLIHIKDATPKYFQSYRKTGDPAPLNLDDAVSVPIEGATILATEDIDVYIYAKTEDGNGKVRVDL